LVFVRKLELLNLHRQNDLLNPDGSVNHSAYGDLAIPIYEQTPIIEEQCSPNPDPSNETPLCEDVIVGWNQTGKISGYGLNFGLMGATIYQSLAVENKTKDFVYLNDSTTVTDFQSTIAVGEFFFKSKTIKEGVKYLKDKFLDKNKLKNKKQHPAYVEKTDEDGNTLEYLDVEEKILNLEGAINEIADILDTICKDNGLSAQSKNKCKEYI